VVWVRSPIHLVEFPADDPDRARRFWTGVLGVELVDRSRDEGRGWQTAGGAPTLGVHGRGKGPGDTQSLPYFEVDDLEAAMRQVRKLGGEVIHPGAQWAVCRDSEGSPFGLAAHKTGI
jgi:predicted enzyme related to lactoylglutathione lyase